jgi:hypothetical protein
MRRRWAEIVVTIVLSAGWAGSALDVPPSRADLAPQTRVSGRSEGRMWRNGHRAPLPFRWVLEFRPGPATAASQLRPVADLPACCWAEFDLPFTAYRWEWGPSDTWEQRWGQTQHFGCCLRGPGAAAAYGCLGRFDADDDGDVDLMDLAIFEAALGDMVCGRS